MHIDNFKTKASIKVLSFRYYSPFRALPVILFQEH